MRMIDQIYTPISQSILDAVREAEEIVVIGHSSPDGDCIFSQLACRRIFTQLGKSVTLLNEGPFTRDEIMAYEKEFLTAVPEGLDFEVTSLHEMKKKSRLALVRTNAVAYLQNTGRQDPGEVRPQEVPAFLCR